MPLPPGAIPYQEKPETTSQQQNTATEHFSSIYPGLYGKEIRRVGAFRGGNTSPEHAQKAQVRSTARNQNVQPSQELIPAFNYNATQSQAPDRPRDQHQATNGINDTNRATLGITYEL